MTLLVGRPVEIHVRKFHDLPWMVYVGIHNQNNARDQSLHIRLDWTRDSDATANTSIIPTTQSKSSIYFW